MSSHRDSLFPATSIGRSPVNSIARTASRESLAAHPLLAPSSDTTALSSNKYVPYTPRQRQATTGSPVLPTVSALPQQQQPSANMHACAARQLQLMNLKAAAQSVGLDAGSVGWAILEKLAHEGDATEDWAEIWNAVTKGKVSLRACGVVWYRVEYATGIATPSSRTIHRTGKDYTRVCSGPHNRTQYRVQRRYTRRCTVRAPGTPR